MRQLKPKILSWRYIPLLLCLGYLSGCSVFFMDQAPDAGLWNVERYQYAECDSRYVHPTLDGLASLAFGVAYLGEHQKESALMILPLLESIALAGIAIYGVVKANRCSDFKDHRETYDYQQGARSSMRPDPWMPYKTWASSSPTEVIKVDVVSSDKN